MAKMLSQKGSEIWKIGARTAKPRLLTGCRGGVLWCCMLIMHYKMTHTHEHIQLMATTPQTKTYRFACLCVSKSHSHAWANPDETLYGLEESTKEGFKPQKVSNLLFGIEEVSYFPDKEHPDK